MTGLVALIMNLYLCKDGTLLYFIKMTNFRPKNVDEA